jgi:hypothetical protein
LIWSSGAAIASQAEIPPHRWIARKGFDPPLALKAEARVFLTSSLYLFINRGDGCDNSHSSTPFSSYQFDLKYLVCLIYTPQSVYFSYKMGFLFLFVALCFV